ncbi:hypothetical protein SDC9_205673 [bioreactor metagenome]|uniref:Uncharacterized protein n=1 Tax=bioreactor metagenome TaxID=1076179 RepID=A0A645J3K4_9ZZZZ
MSPGSEQRGAHQNHHCIDHHQLCIAARAQNIAVQRVELQRQGKGILAVGEGIQGAEDEKKPEDGRNVHPCLLHLLAWPFWCMPVGHRHKQQEGG